RWPGGGGTGNEEVGNAAVRDPDALVVVAPRFPEQARRLTVRAGEHDALRGVRGALLTLTDLRRARDRYRNASLCACGCLLLVVSRGRLTSCESGNKQACGKRADQRELPMTRHRGPW